MRTYADSSFILRLVTRETESPQVIAEYRRLQAPDLFFLPLHAVEVRNAIRQRAHFQRRSLAAGERSHVAHERDAALSRLDQLLIRRAFLDVTVDMEMAARRAEELSATHTERLGARAIDLLHVASALLLESELFLTTEIRQSQLAKAEGLRVITTT